jgi:hypothetical protein
MSISNYAELKILDHTTGRAAWTMPYGVCESCIWVILVRKLLLRLLEDTRKVAAWATAASGSIATSATLEWTSVAATETYSHWSCGML